jgi:uncharacterized membrane protein (DUF373 family)
MLNKSRINGPGLFEKILQKIENFIIIVVAIIILIVVFISLIRIIFITYESMILDIFKPSNIKFEVYTDIFAKIITVLISFEFLNSITKALRTHEIRLLVLDVSLITALAICRKLIIMEYPDHNTEAIIGLGIVLIAIGVFYFLITFKKPNGNNHKNEDENKSKGIRNSKFPD